VTAK
jgi:hypothetical protein